MKTVLKRLANLAAQLAIAGPLMLYWLGALLIGSERVFPGWSQMFSLVPGVIGAYLRRAFYSWVVGGCGEDVWITFGSIFSHRTARVGERVYVGAFCCLGSVTLEDDVLVGSHVSIMNGARQHGIERLDTPVREQPGEWPHVIIGRDTWIGDRAIVMANVGRHCVVAAGAVVTKEVPDYAIVAGSPARVIRYRNQLAEASTGDPADVPPQNPIERASL